MQTWSYPQHHPTDPGPWADEPDKAQWVDEVTGLDCLIVRSHTGALCGYVGVPPGHPWYRLPAHLIKVRPLHGDINYASLCQEVDNPDQAAGAICHVPAPGRPEHVWWIGFDCAHYFDYAPLHEQRLREAMGEYYIPYADMKSETYRTFAYVQDVVTDLAWRVHEAATRTGP